MELLPRKWPRVGLWQLSNQQETIIEDKLNDACAGCRFRLPVLELPFVIHGNFPAGRPRYGKEEQQ